MRNLCAWPKDVSCLRLCSSKCLIKQMCHVCERISSVIQKSLCFQKELVLHQILLFKSSYSASFQRIGCSKEWTCAFPLQSFEQVEFIPHQNQKCLCGSFVLGLLYATCSYFAPFCKWLSLFKMIARNPFIVSANNAHNHCVTWTECLLRQSTSFWFLLGFDDFTSKFFPFQRSSMKSRYPFWIENSRGWLVN